MFFGAAPGIADPIRVFGAELRGLFEADGAGPYHDAFSLLTASYDGDLNLMMAPQKRAENQFGQGTGDCLFAGSALPGYYKKYGLPDDQLLVSDTIFSFKMKVYGPRNSPAIEDLANLEGQTIAVDIGVGNVDYIADRMGHPRVLALPIQALAQGFQLLDVGRVAALVAVDLDVRYLQARHAGFTGYPVSETLNVMESRDVLVCRRSPETEVFIDHVNREIQALQADYRLDALLDRYLTDTPQPRP